MTAAKPSPGDIQAAIIAAEDETWIDPSDPALAGRYWGCEITDPDGYSLGQGDALTPGMAMGLAWLHLWAPDALIAAYVEPGTVPFTVPDGFRFTLTPPGQEQPPRRHLPPLSEDRWQPPSWWRIDINGEPVGKVWDFGFVWHVEGEDLLPDGGAFVPSDPTAFVASLRGVAREAVRFVSDRDDDNGAGAGSEGPAVPF